MQVLKGHLCAGYLIALLTGLSLSGCSGGSDAIVGSMTPSSVAAGAQAPVYKIGNRTTVKVAVFGEEKLGGEHTVDAAGKFSMPLIGEIAAKGLTARQLTQNITGKLKGRFLVDPKVTVIVLNYRPFYMMGEVKSIGEHPFKEGLTVVSAIALAGGFTDRGNSKYVYITRAGTTGETQYPTASNTWVYPGDTIRVAERYF